MSIGVHIDRNSKGDLIAASNIVFNALPSSECAQIFTFGPRTMAKCKYPTDAELIDLCQRKRIFVHQTYFTSWTPKGNWHMKEQYEHAQIIGSKGLVLHLGLISPKGHIDVLESLGVNFKDSGCPFILEMRALKLQQWSYQTPQEINLLITEIKSRGYKPQDICICIDLAHIAAGKQKINTAQEMADWIEEIEDWDYIGLLHLNGNQYDCCKRSGDKHTIPAAANDTVFNSTDKKGYLEILTWHVKERHKDAIVEVDFSDELVKFISELA